MNESSKDKVLFTLGEWSIHKAEYVYHGHSGRVSAYAYHITCQGEETYDLYARRTVEPTNCWHTGDILAKCILCSTAVPDEIQGLVILYQYGGE